MKQTSPVCFSGPLAPHSGALYTSSDSIDQVKEDIAAVRIAFDIPLKGERNYLHSTNILTQFRSHFSFTGPVKLEFRRMIHHPIYLAADVPDHPDRVGKFAFKTGDEWQTYGIFTDEARTITGHLPNNEPAIAAASTFGADGEDWASGHVGQPASFIDTIVGLNKVLVARHAKGKKAIFSAIAIDVMPDDGKVGVSLTKRLGSKIFMSDVLWNDRKIGNLTFMAD